MRDDACVRVCARVDACVDVDARPRRAHVGEDLMRAHLHLPLTQCCTHLAHILEELAPAGRDVLSLHPHSHSLLLIRFIVSLSCIDVVLAPPPKSY